jgi:large subunit ribosomal protein L32e
MQLNEKLRLMRIRKTKNKQRPSFARYESWRYKKLSKSGWRKQRGIDNKTRRKNKMGVKSPEPGYRGPKNVRDLHPSGLEDILVMHPTDLDDLNPKFQGIRIARRLGVRKRMQLIEIAQEKGFKIFNIGLSKEDLYQMKTEDAEIEEDTEEKIEDDEAPAQLSKKDQIKKLKKKNMTPSDEIVDAESESEAEESEA